MRPIPITRQLQIDLYAWTAAVANARADYQVHPNRACHAHDCIDLSDDGERFCREHLRLALAARKRMAARRKDKKK